jgi:hypothetical protein
MRLCGPASRAHPSHPARRPVHPFPTQTTRRGRPRTRPMASLGAQQSRPPRWAIAIHGAMGPTARAARKSPPRRPAPRAPHARPAPPPPPRPQAAPASSTPMTLSGLPRRRRACAARWTSASRCAAGAGGGGLGPACRDPHGAPPLGRAPPNLCSCGVRAGPAPMRAHPYARPQVLEAGGSALDATVAAVVALEDDPRFNAGGWGARGGVPDPAARQQRSVAASAWQAVCVWQAARPQPHLPRHPRAPRPPRRPR